MPNNEQQQYLVESELTKKPDRVDVMAGSEEGQRKRRSDHYPEYRKQYRIDHKDHKSAYDKQYKLLNKERIKAQSRERMRRYWRKMIATDPLKHEERKSYMRRMARKRYADNPQKYKDDARTYERSNRLKIRVWRNRRNREVKLTALHKYGGKCTCCGELEVGFLTMDHVKSDGALHRKTFPSKTLGFYRWLCRNPVSDDFQVLCMNCNWGRGKNNGVCPHRNPQGTVCDLLGSI